MGHKYVYEIDLSDGSAPARVVRMAGREKRVLEIGAGPGSMTRVLRDVFGCRVTAVEIDESVIPMLTPFCERVYRADLNDPAWIHALQGEPKFDAIIVADVLEHLYDPWSALPSIKTLLAADGEIIVSIPHTGHNAIIGCLLSEDLEYRDAGLLDRTHIRFFGMKNIQALFDSAGLAITEAEFVVRLPEETEFAAAWDRVPPELRVQLSKNPFGDIYQVVAKAVPLEAARERLSLTTMGLPGRLTDPLPPTTAVPLSKGDSSTSPNVRLLAFYLPQFHPTPENNLWWGKGFTEWTNVTKAGPLFPGHYQPHLPSDLGFYDLRLRETRLEQIALAKQYGIDGFCYYYYWFSGTRILNRPLDDMLADPESDMPFCLCWANENWTRRWDGADHEILIAQKYLPTDDVEFIKSLAPFFADPRYIRLNGAPFFIVYQPQHLPDAQKSIDTWREYCERNGIGKIHVCGALTNDNENYAKLGFDSGLQFPPHNRKCGSVNDRIDFYTPFHGCVVEYEDLAESYMHEVYPHPNVFRTICPSWDQTARVGSRAFIVLNGTPANYEYWLKESIRRTAEDFPDQERFVFINAWNEWAEGCHLEPDRRFQRQFLEATLRAKTNRSEKASFEERDVPKAVEPLTSVAARLNEVEQDLAIETRRRTTAEQDLADERERLSAVYYIEQKREELAALASELATARYQISAAQSHIGALSEEVTAERALGSRLDSQLKTRQQTVSADPVILSRALEAFVKTVLVESPQGAAYLNAHKKRIEKSLEWLEPHFRADSRVLELGGTFFARIFQTIYPGVLAEHTSTDLRYPLPIPSEEYDIVINTELLEHLKDQVESDVDHFEFSGLHTLLAESYRVLKAGGLMFVTTPNAAGIGIIYRTLMGISPHLYCPHVREYTVHELARFLEEHRFTLERVETLSVYDDDLPADKCAAISAMLANDGYNLQYRGDCSFVIARK